MDSDDEMVFSPPAESASPIRRTTLRRLKKGARLPKSPTDESQQLPSSNLVLSSVEQGEVGGVDHGSAEFGAKSDAVPVFEVAENVEMMESDEHVGIGFSDPPEPGDVGDEVSGENAQDGGDKLGLNGKPSDEGKEEGKKVKKKRAKSRVGDEATAPLEEKRRKNGKRRKAYLDMMHAESQRLLRETRHVSFEPVPLVHKPISSVLEKIRRRRLEISTRFNSAGTLVNDMESSFNQERTEVPVALECGQTDDPQKLDKAIVNIANKRKNESQGGTKDKAVDIELPDGQSENSDSEDKQPEVDSYSPEETEDFVPSVLATSLNFESPVEEDSSEEEDNDKENIDPEPDGVDPAKAFVDDEAEEESDSDNEPMGSADSEEEGKEIDAEIEDLIAPTYEETAVDSERRDELHRIWLQQQDAAATENLCQRLRAQNSRDDSALLVDEQDRELLDLDHSDESMANEPPPRGTKKRIKELRQLSLQMFNDDDDIYLSSGDEEEDIVQVHKVLHDRTEDRPSLKSPGSGSDEGSREVFGLIKKLNIAPPTKKTTKKSSFLETLVIGSNSNGSSRSSFLSRVHSNSLPSYRKQISNNSRSFVFSRDDSRSGTSTSNVSFDTEQSEKQPKKNARAKCSNSQPKSSTFNARAGKESNSGPSLFQLLRMSSMNSSHSIQRSESIGNSQAFQQFAAFKLSKKSIKIEGRS